MNAALRLLAYLVPPMALWLAVAGSEAAQRETSVPQAQAAPAFPFRYSGRLEREGLPPLAALTRGSDTLLVSRGDTIESLYRLEEIDSRHITVTYLPLRQKQTIELASLPPETPAAPVPPQAPAPPKTPLGTPGPACC